MWKVGYLDIQLCKFFIGDHQDEDDEEVDGGDEDGLGGGDEDDAQDLDGDGRCGHP